MTTDNHETSTPVDGFTVAQQQAMVAFIRKTANRVSPILMHFLVNDAQALLSELDTPSATVQTGYTITEINGIWCVLNAEGAQPVTLLCAIRLADKVRYVDGVKIVREQWSHAVYPAFVWGDWIRVRYGNGVIYRKREDIRLQGDVVAESKVA